MTTAKYVGATPLLLSLALALAPGAQAQPSAAPPPARDCQQPSAPDELVVCGRPEDDDRHRLPLPDGFDPGGTTPSVLLERHMLLDLGATGIGSCSTVGPGGWTGCQLRQWERDRLQWAGKRPGERRGDVSIRIGRMRPE